MMNSNGSGSEVEANNADEILLEPFNYIEKESGNHIGAKLTKVFNFWMNIPSDKCTEIEKMCQMLQTAKLLIDDIKNNSKFRGGIPVAHDIFGVPSTINSANYVYSLGLEKTLKLDHPEATKVFTEQLLTVHQGQGMDLYWRDKLMCPSEEEYKEIVKKETGGLFGLGIKLMQLFSKNERDFTQITDIIGLYFQIRDDYDNLMSKEYKESKSFCEDISEGKFTFPVIHAIQNNPNDPRLMNIIKQRTTDIEIKKYALSIMEKMGSFDYTRKVLRDLDAQAREEIERLGHNSYLIAVLDELQIL